MIFSEASCGACLMILSGLLSTGNFVLGKYLRDQEWPYLRMMGFDCLLLAMCIACGLKAVHSKLPAPAYVKWVVLRGFFGALNFVLTIVSIYAGARLGDVAALTSINIIAAALLGRVFLGESLRWFHLAALNCSCVGSVLICKPAILFGESSTQGSWLGYVLAPIAGFCQACVFIASRKSAGVSAWMQLFSTMLQVGLVCALLPYSPIVHDRSLAPLAVSPWLASAWLGLIFFLVFCSSMSMSTGSRLCPAAVSATVSTAVRMTSGYLAQAMLFRAAVEPLTLCGAGLMLISVVILAAASRHADPSAPSITTQEFPETPVSVVASVSPSSNRTENTCDTDETESLASFIAAEFTTYAPNEKALRQRRAAWPDEPVAQQVGMASAVAVLSI